MLSYIKNCMFVFLTINLFAANGKSIIEIDNGDITTHARIAADATGQYIYNIQVINDGSNDIVQVTRSSDYGANWENPTTTTGDGGIPNLSKNGRDAKHPQITTDSTGQYVYAVWQRFSEGKYIIQVASSSDYGASWDDPTLVTGSESPNLSSSRVSSFEPQISTDSTGQYVFVIWLEDSGAIPTLQIVTSKDYGASWKDPLMGRCSLFLN